MSNFNITPCLGDENCTGFTVCYTNVDWSPIRGGFCDCETPYYGWLGSDCNSFGPTTYFGIIGFTIILVVSIPPMIVAGLIAYDTWKYPKLRQWNPLFQTLVLVTLCFTSFFFYGIFNLVERLTPELYVEFFSGERSHPYSPLSGLISLLAVTFFVFGASNTVLVWIDIANSVSILANVKTIPRVRYFLRGMQVYGVLLLIVMLATRNLTVGGAGLLPVLVGILLLYVLGRKRFTTILRNVTQPVGTQDGDLVRNIESKMLPLIERTFATTTIALFLVMFSTIIGAALDANRRNLSPKGVVSPVVSCLLVIAYCGWLGNLGTALYVYVLIYNRRLKFVGPLPYRKRIEAILFAGYSSFVQPSYNSQFSTNPSYQFRTTEVATGGTDSDEKVRGLRSPSFDGLAKLGQVAKGNAQGLAKRIRRTSKLGSGPETGGTDSSTTKNSAQGTGESTGDGEDV